MGLDATVGALVSLSTVFNRLKNGVQIQEFPLINLL